MSIEQQRTKTVYSVIQQLVADGAETFLPGDVATVLRDDDRPLAYWEIRREFTRLSEAGLIKLDEDTAVWQLCPDHESTDRKSADQKSAGQDANKSAGQDEKKKSRKAG